MQRGPGKRLVPFFAGRKTAAFSAIDSVDLWSLPMTKSIRAVLVTASLLAGGMSAEALAKRLEITVNKVSQKMTVRLDGDTEHVWLVSTGRSGYDTPSGKFRPFRLEIDHYSKEWDDAPMPYSIFFTAEGHAIHGTEYVGSLGRRASHGCIRLSEGNAAKLFDLVEQVGLSNTAVVIKGGFFDFGFGDDTPKPFAVENGNSKPKLFSADNGSKTSKKKKKKKLSFFGT
jgi:lipoprotein-anchoring transpeptidase ErfK/SrfK